MDKNKYKNEELELRKKLETTDKNILISAGAGAGKTELMARAVLNHLNLRKELKESQVVVITFTNAAAEELRKRINDRYYEMRRKNSSFRILCTDDINISTIHSFCANLVRQRAIDCELGVYPAYSDEKKDYTDEIKRFLRKYISENAKEYSRLKKYWGNNTYGVVFNNLSAVAMKRGFDIQQPPVIIPDDEKRATAVNDLSESTGKIIEMVRQVQLSRKTKSYTLLGFVDKYNSWKSGDKNRWYIIINIAESLLFKRKDSKDNLTDEQFVEADALNMPELLESLKNDRTSLTADFIKKMYDRLEKERRDSELNNNTVLYMTSKLLEKKEAINFFRNKYKVFFVDEFQDTDYLQTKILLKLCCKENTGNPALRDGSVFLVGDPKQSIYRFTGAEVGLYDYMRKKFFEGKDNGEYFSLSLNYRSQKELIDCINDKYNIEGRFGRTIGEGPAAESIVTETEYNDMIAAMTPSLTYDEKKQISDLICSGVENGDEPTKMTASELAQKVMKLQKKTIRLVVRDDDGTVRYDKRNVRWSDFLILTKSKKEATEVYNSLKNLGIPSSVSGDNKPEENRAFVRLRAMIRYMRDDSPLHLAELIGSLMPLNKNNYQDSTKASTNKCGIFNDADDNDIGAISEIIKSIKEMYSEKSAMAVLYHAFSQGWLTDMKISYIDMISELPLLYQFFEGLFSEAHDHIDSIAEYIEKFMKKEHKRLLSPSDKTDCVRVMNFHQAKGLESNIVINFMSKTLKEEKDPHISSSYCKYLEENEKGEPVAISDRPKMWLTIDEKISPSYSKHYDNLSKEQKERYINDENCELIRKLYVCNTRARVREYDYYINKDNTNSNAVSKASAVYDAEYILEPLTKHYCLDKHYVSTSPSRLENSLEKKPTKVQPEKSEIISEKNIDEKGEENKNNDAALKGTIMHRAFELFLANSKLSPIKEEDYGMFVSQAIIENRTDTDEGFKDYDQILMNLKNFAAEFRKEYNDVQTALETPLYGIFEKIKDNSLSQEMMNLIKQKDKEDNPEKVFFTGYSDLIVFRGQEAFVIDYKSDHNKTDDEFIKTYKPQQQAYIKCFGSVLCGVKNKITLYAANKNESRWVTDEC